MEDPDMSTSIKFISCVPVKLRTKLKFTTSPILKFRDFNISIDVDTFLSTSIRPETLNSPLQAVKYDIRHKLESVETVYSCLHGQDCNYILHFWQL